MVIQQLHYSASKVALGELKHHGKLYCSVVHGSISELSTNQAQIPNMGLLLLLFLALEN